MPCLQQRNLFHESPGGKFCHFGLHRHIRTQVKRQAQLHLYQAKADQKGQTVSNAQVWDCVPLGRGYAPGEASSQQLLGVGCVRPAQAGSLAVTAQLWWESPRSPERTELGLTLSDATTQEAGVCRVLTAEMQERPGPHCGLSKQHDG